MWTFAAALAADPGPMPIVNGVPEPGFPSVVGLGAAGLTICTGNLVTPRVVLTAAHCQADLPFELVVALGTIYVGEDARAPTHELGLAEAYVHPDYRELTQLDLGENDVGVLVLDADAPEDVAPVPFRTSRLTRGDAVGATVTSAGYGLTEDGTSGAKHSAELVVSGLDPVFVLADSADNAAGANVCSGDSGGPQLFRRDDGRLEQWSVHSWADVNCRFQSGSTRTDVPSVSNWLLERVAAVHGTADLCRINGYYSDDVCDTDCPGFDPACADWPFPPHPAGGCDASGGAGPWAALGAALAAIRRKSASGGGPGGRGRR